MTARWARGLGLGLAALALSFAACSKCGKTPAGAGAGIERLLPRSAAAVAVIPNLQSLGERLKGLQGLKVAAFSAQLNGFTDAHQWADALVQQLGVDLRSKEALEAAGLEPAGAAAVVAMPDRLAYLVLPVKDEAKLAAALQRLSSARLGAGIAEDLGGSTPTVRGFAAQKGTPLQLAYALVGGFALIGTDQSVGKLAGWAKLPEAESVAKDPAWAAAQGRLPKDRDLLLYLGPGSPAMRGTVSNAMAVLALRPEGLTLTADAAWTGDPKALELLVKQPAADLLGYLPADAWLVAKFSGDPARLGPWVERLLPQLSRAFAESGLDLNAEVLANLKPGAVAGLSLAPTARLSGMPELDLRSTNPFTWAHLTGVTEVKQPQQVPATLEKFTLLAPRIGSQMAKTDRAGHPVYFTTYSAGEGVHFAARGPNVFFGSPAGRIDALLGSGGKATAVLNPALAGVLDSRALTVVIDLQKLADAVRELPSAAWGIGGFAIKATTLRWLDATDDLQAITVGVDSKGGAIQAQLVLALTPAGPAPKVP